MLFYFPSLHFPFFEIDYFYVNFPAAWRAKEIFNQEDIYEASHVIPGHKMARLLSLFLCNDLSKEKSIFAIIERVTKGMLIQYTIQTFFQKMLTSTFTPTCFVFGS